MRLDQNGGSRGQSVSFFSAKEKINNPKLKLRGVNISGRREYKLVEIQHSILHNKTTLGSSILNKKALLHIWNS